MLNKVHFDEARQVQLPAVELLISLGYEYISVSEALRERGGDERNVILRDIARAKLMEINSYELDGEKMQFTPRDVNEAIDELENLPFEGLQKTAQNIYRMIMPTSGGKTVEVRKGDSKNFRFIDFAEPHNNAFHVTVEYTVVGKEEIRPDIVCFVNGFPIAVIESKKHTVSVEEALEQMVRNQGVEYAPKLYTFAQILVGSNGTDFRYGTTGTGEKFYAVWKEKPREKGEADLERLDARVKELIAQPIAVGVYQELLNDLSRGQSHHEQLCDRPITAQDRSIVALFTPERLLDLTKHFVIFDAMEKKIARYQQYFAIEKMRRRVMEKEAAPEGGERRRGGIVWHTQGSGKSLTMVLFVKALIEDEHIKNPRVIIVTDRRDLDRQIKGTFENCGLKKDVVQAKTGQHLLDLIQEKNLGVITTLVQKFESVAKKREDFVDPDENIFVLIDEAHRTHGGMASLEMSRTIPNACYIAFTGTPLMREEKESWRRFGAYIDKYTIDDAVLDGNVLPLIYEGRFVPLVQNAKKIDELVDRVKERAIHKYQSNGEEDKREEESVNREALVNNPQRLREIVHDIESHYKMELQGTGLKAQVVAPSKFAAVKMQQMFLESGLVKSAVVVSDESGIVHEDDYRRQEVVDFLDKIKDTHSSIEEYEKEVIRDFKDNADGVEVLIVVHKLLTGFDAPRNTVLYLAKSLRDHDLLQAIARVNRLCDKGKKQKTSGYIIDYSENAQHLKSAMQLFGNYEEDDVHGTLVDVGEKMQELAQAYAAIHDIFRGVHGAKTVEPFMEVLKAEDTRVEFNAAVNTYTKLFSECLALKDFNENFKDIDLYKRELRKFVELRKLSRFRYGERTDFNEYKFALMRILDQYVDTEGGVERLTEKIDVRDIAQVRKAVEEIVDSKEKAEAIATQVNKTIHDREAEDPVYYKSLSERVEEIIRAMREGRMQDLVALEGLEELLIAANEKKQASVPSQIEAEHGADLFYRNLLPHFERFHLISDQEVMLSLSVFKIIKEFAIVDFEHNVDVQRRMRSALDDYLYDGFPSEWNVSLSSRERGDIVAAMVELAKHNHELFSA